MWNFLRKKKKGAVKIEPMLDLSMVADSTNHDPELALGILESIEEGLQSYPSQLKEYFQQQGLDKAFSKQVHNFKSGAAYLGNPSFTALLNRVENFEANQLGKKEVAALLETIEEASANLLQLLEEEIKLLKER